MALIDPGTDGIISANNLENYFFQLIVILENDENNVSFNADSLDNIQYSISDNIVTGNFVFPVNAITTGTTNPVTTYKGYSYLSGTSFIPSTDGDILITDVVEHFQAIVNNIQSKESSSVTNPNSNNYVTSSISGDSNRVTGTFSLPCSVITNTDGTVSVNILEYLL